MDVDLTRRTARASLEGIEDAITKFPKLPAYRVTKTEAAAITQYVRLLEADNMRLRNQAAPFKGGAPHNGSDTSIAAANSVAPKAGAKRQHILDLFRRHGRLMCGEVEDLTGWKHQTVSARIRELVLEGAIVDTGARGVYVGSGRSQRVYEMPKPGRLF